MRRALSRTPTGVFVGLAAVVLLAGCGAQAKAEETAAAASEKAVEKAVTEATGGGDVDVDSESGVISLEVEGKTLRMGEDLAMPDGFPETLPLPEGGHSVNAVIAEQGVFEVTMFVTDGDLRGHEEQIRDSLTAAGYEIDATTETTVEGIDQRIVKGVGHDTEIAVVFSSPWDKPSVHYSVTPPG